MTSHVIINTAKESCIGKAIFTDYQRLRKGLKFTQIEKKAFVKKEVTTEAATDVKYLHILVFKTEGHWAYGQS